MCNRPQRGWKRPQMREILPPSMYWRSLYLEGRLGEKDVEKAGEAVPESGGAGKRICGISPWQAVSGRGGDPKRYGGGCLVADRSGGTGAALCPVHTGMSVSEGEEIPQRHGESSCMAAEGGAPGK